MTIKIIYVKSIIKDLVHTVNLAVKIYAYFVKKKMKKKTQKITAIVKSIKLPIL